MNWHQAVRIAKEVSTIHPRPKMLHYMYTAGLVVSASAVSSNTLQYVTLDVLTSEDYEDYWLVGQYNV